MHGLGKEGCIMANVYYATIHAKFYNSHLRDVWLKEHGVDQSVPNGGPVTSYSQDAEGSYRDINSVLLEALKEIKTYIEQEGQELRDLYPVFGLNGDKMRKTVNAAISRATGGR